MKKILKVFEFCGSIIFSIIIVLALKIFNINSISITRIDTFIATLSTVSITIIGFMIALIGILIGLIHSDIIKRIQITGKVTSFYGLLIQPLIYSILLLIYSFWLMFSLDDTGQILSVNFYLLVFLSGLFVTSIFQIAVYINLIFLNILKEDSSSKSESKDAGKTSKTRMPNLSEPDK